MNPDNTLQGALDKVSRDVTTSSTLPPACYRDATALDAERLVISQRSWLGIGRGDRWASAGDYAVLSLAGASVIVTRDEDKNLRAFANTCRHRGTALLTGEGNVARIVCPFHGWTYALDGSLRGATRMGHASDFRHEDFGLIEFRTSEHAGFAYVCLSPDTPPLDTWLGNFDEHHTGWPLETLVTTRYRHFEVNCNWKLFLEVFNESYHLDCVHADTFGGIYQEPDQPDTSTGCVHTQFSPTVGTGGLKKDEQDQSLPMMPGLNGRNREGTRYSWVFPSMTFAAGSEALWGLRCATDHRGALPRHPVGMFSTGNRLFTGFRNQGGTLLHTHGRSARRGHCGSRISTEGYVLAPRAPWALVGDGEWCGDVCRLVCRADAYTGL